MQVAELNIKKGGKIQTYRIFPGEKRTVYGFLDTFVDWNGPNARLWANGKSLSAELNTPPQRLDTQHGAFSLSFKPWELRKDLGHLPGHVLGELVHSAVGGLGDISGLR